MLGKAEKDLGGTLAPVVAHTTEVGRGMSQSIIEGSQLPVSTSERTLVDSVLYTKEIGGAGEALLWTRAGMSRSSIDYNELGQVLIKVYARVNSVAARFGFLLEMALSDLEVRAEYRASVNKLLTRLEGLSSKTRATYNWGPEKTSVKYFQKWHLRVSTGYMKQLKEAPRLE